MNQNAPLRPPHKSEWVLNQVTDELNARPFPRFGLPTALFRLCLAGPQARDSLRQALAAELSDIDWDSDAKLMRSTKAGVQFNIEQHTEFVSLTVIDEKADQISAAQHLPDNWLAHMAADIVVAVDCYCTPRGATPRDGWSCASRLEGGLADAFFDFKVAEDGHTKIALDFDAAANVRDIGRLALQVMEIETYRSFAALGLPQARGAQARLAAIAARVPNDALSGYEAAQHHHGEGADDGAAADDASNDATNDTTHDGSQDAMRDADRFGELSALAAQLEAIWRETSFRFAACQAYWALVEARLASLGEAPFDNRITIGGFLERRLQPAIATYQSTERQRHNLAEQIGNMTTLLQTRIELSLQRQNAALLTSLNMAAERQLRLQHTVEGVSTVAISYYLVSLLTYPADWLLAALPWLERGAVRTALVMVTVPLVWISIRRLLRASIKRK